ncbi:Outer membrane lipoprotein-sorting protein [Paenibacillus tianmuensis]|uniref:Outer membrane lipoprotein-sorting protein n=1 Tax=Paenibacillus tianmuensis TaxID=624147 RepID=A0A1G4SX26_9BACL|nr:outer membrane lipoprotein-sorting protein [Paenibacillus tianmuensis]SCW73693.1 Outer membrane lipoprotein-sorting protein [Paenibacillus tianmuensis]
MRRFTWVVALVMVCLSLVVSGCGKRDAGSVVKELDGVMSKLQSYHGKGQMTLRTGQDPQEYDVEVSFQAPSFYRISLTNAKKDITQIVLRNDDGVFVLTPHLNKSFRFQSDWPENQGQVYLYQSLVQSILMDNERHFTSDEKAYVFDVVANYQNGSLARQKVWLDKRNYAPQHVEVSDANSNVMVIVKFDQFEFGTKFEKDQFDMQRNMTGWNLKTLPTMMQGDSKTGEKSGATDSKAETGAASGNRGTGTKETAQETGGKGTAAGQGAGTDAKGDTTNTNKGNTAGAATGESKGTSASGSGEGAKTSSVGGNKGAAGNGAQAAATGAKKDTSKQQSLGIIEPRYMPSGVKKQDVTELKLGEEQAVMLRYSGKYNYTLMESRPQVQTVSILPGDILDLGFTLGVVTGDAKKTLTWTYDGIEFRLSTGDLPATEMIKVAQAVQGEIGK